MKKYLVLFALLAVLPAALLTTSCGNKAPASPGGGDDPPPAGSPSVSPSVSTTPTATPTQTATATATATTTSTPTVTSTTTVTHQVYFTASGTWTSGTLNVDANAGVFNDIQNYSGTSFSYTSPTGTVAAGTTISCDITTDNSALTSGSINTYIDGTLVDPISFPAASSGDLLSFSVVVPTSLSNIHTGVTTNVYYTSNSTVGEAGTSYLLPDGATAVIAVNGLYTSPTYAFYPSELAKIHNTTDPGSNTFGSTFSVGIYAGGVSVAGQSAANGADANYTVP